MLAAAIKKKTDRPVTAIIIVKMEAVSSLQPRDQANLEPPIMAEFPDSFAGHLMCCEPFTVPHSMEQQVGASCSAPEATTDGGGTDVNSLNSPSHLVPQAVTLHVEVLQQSCSSLSASVVRDYAVAELKRHPTAFGEFTLTEFDDPVLKEHVVSISVCDVPSSIQVYL